MSASVAEDAASWAAHLLSLCVAMQQLSVIVEMTTLGGAARAGFGAWQQELGIGLRVATAQETGRWMGARGTCGGKPRR